MDNIEKNKDVGRNAQETANLIWNAANSLFGAFKPHEYGLVILPMCVIKRFHDCLADTRQAVWDADKKFAALGARKVPFLKQAAGYQFYNTSNFTFDKLKSIPDEIEENFEDFIHGFSDNVQAILNRMNFHAQIERMKEAKLLYQIICDFSIEDLNMSEKNISTVDMGYIFENLVQRFSESYDEEAGAHFTSRDIIYLMCDLLTHNSSVLEMDEDAHCTVYDMAMGTSQMLTCMEERIQDRYPEKNIDVQTFGQEINPFTMGIAAADTLIHGGDPENMKFGDTLSDDQFSGYHFDFVISNPPFGIDWKREASVVEKEHKLGESGRFAPGLPAKGDGQMLFLLNGLAKLKENGRMAIIQNGSSLFTGDAESGPSEIRRYFIENDWLDAIIQLPTGSFYNTPIATYIWIVDKNKPENHKGTVHLIDASECFVSRRKNIGDKKNDITEECRELILKAYSERISTTYEYEIPSKQMIKCRSKILLNKSFGYWKITIETPLVDDQGNKILKKGKPIADASKRDTENVPMEEDIQVHFDKEVIPYNPIAWIDSKKTKVGYEIPFTRTFYEYKPIEPSEKVAERIEEHEKSLMAKLHDLFGKG